ncbi:MAG: 3-deoxy-D-manno-octulosonic acid transferase [Gemmobacter sp.]
MQTGLAHRLWRLTGKSADDGTGSGPDSGRSGQGPVVLLYAGSAETARGLVALAAGLRAAEPAVELVFAGSPGLQGVAGLPAPLEVPTVGSASAERFLRDLAPALCIVAGGALPPRLLSEAGRLGIPLMAVEAGPPRLTASRWWPGLLSGIVQTFGAVFVTDSAAELAWRRAGVRKGIVRIAGRLEEPSHALPHNEAERAALARVFGTRPLWLAACVPPAEDALVAAAHQEALRMAHRLLLIVVPDDPSRADALAASLTEVHGLSVARRGLEEEPGEETQVYLADTEGELGLWLRLAPVVWMGGTHAGPSGQCHPFAAAALGAAILHGPVSAPHALAYDRLRRAGASRLVRSPAALGEAVGDLLSPDRTARLAQAAWDVISQGAQATAEAVATARRLLHATGPAA